MKCGKCSLMFSPLQKKKKKITPAGALQHETFQLKRNFHPHCWGDETRRMTKKKDGIRRERYGGEGGRGERNKRMERREGREDERGKIQVFDTSEMASRQGRKHTSW